MRKAMVLAIIDVIVRNELQIAFDTSLQNYVLFLFFFWLKSISENNFQGILISTRTPWILRARGDLKMFPVEVSST